MDAIIQFTDLANLANQVMQESQFLTQFSSEVQNEVNENSNLDIYSIEEVEDLRTRLWFSIDNDDTKDIDQLTFAKQIQEDLFKIYIAVADVAFIVKKNSPLDLHAQYNTTSVYTPVRVFHMLPEIFSNKLTSLIENEDRKAVIAEIDISGEGAILSYKIYPALVRNHARLTYNNVAAWLEGKTSLPERFSYVDKLEEQIRLHDFIAQKIRQYRHDQGALVLERIDSNPIIRDSKVVDIKIAKKNRARELIEDFMIATNTATAQFLTLHHLPSIRRIVRQPARWDRIVAIAKMRGETLPDQPDVKALNIFMIKQRTLDPDAFTDLSLAIIKLIGEGEYIVEYPGKESIGHFSLAVKDYIHSTAPNRRYPDLITQRLLKAALTNASSPYTIEELEQIAEQCTNKENDAAKVERRIRKSTMIFFLSPHLNETFDALVTGASPKGTWVRIFKPPVEGKLIEGFEGLDIADRITVKLVHLDIEKGHIDFVASSAPSS